MLVTQSLRSQVTTLLLRYVRYPDKFLWNMQKAETLYKALGRVEARPGSIFRQVVKGEFIFGALIPDTVSYISHLQGVEVPLLTVQKLDKSAKHGIFYELPLDQLETLARHTAHLDHPPRVLREFLLPPRVLICTKYLGGESGREPLFSIEEFDGEGHRILYEIYNEQTSLKVRNYQVVSRRAMMLGSRTKVDYTGDGFTEYEEVYQHGKLYLLSTARYRADGDLVHAETVTSPDPMFYS